MNATARVLIFIGGLAAVFGAAFVLGGAVDPDGPGDEPTAHAGDGDPHGGEAEPHAGRGHAAKADGSSASAPARLVVDDRRFEPGVREQLRFRVVDRAGRTVHDFDVEHEREMHVIAARHDLTGYQHVHPRRTADGGWAVDVAFPEAGPQRVFADFSSGGESYTLGADVRVAGAYAPRELPSPAARAGTGDYEVAVAEHGSERRFTVAKGGRPVTDIEPYLGARGHLVALREGDLAFQHVHPKDAATVGREIRFDVSLAKAGRYRLFLQFKHGGAVRTVAFTEVARGDGEAGHRHGEAGHGH